jgi:spore coat protein CotH
VELTVEPDDLALLVPYSDLRVPCTLSYDDVVLANVGVRLKGGIGSARPIGQKPGFSFKTNEFVSGQKLHGIKRFTLNNAVQDPSFVSEFCAYEVWRRAGVPVRRCAHARVSLNGEYLGVYVVAESYEGDFLGDHFDDDDGNLYEGTYGVDLTDVGLMELKTNEEENDRSDLEALAAVIELASDDDLPTALDGVLDVEEFLTYWAVEALIDHWDGYAAQNQPEFSYLGPNNYYAYGDPSTGRFSLLPHGADLCFNRSDASVLAPPHEKSRLAARCFAHPELRARYEARVREVLAAAWDVPAFEARLDAAWLRIAGSVHEGDQNPDLTFDRFVQSLESRRACFRARPAVVLAQLP